MMPTRFGTRGSLGAVVVMDRTEVVPTQPPSTMAQSQRAEATPG